MVVLPAKTDKSANELTIVSPSLSISLCWILPLFSYLKNSPTLTLVLVASHACVQATPLSKLWSLYALAWLYVPVLTPTTFNIFVFLTHLPTLTQPAEDPLDVSDWPTYDRWLPEYALSQRYERKFKQSFRTSRYKFFLILNAIQPRLSPKDRILPEAKLACLLYCLGHSRTERQLATSLRIKL